MRGRVLWPWQKQRAAAGKVSAPVLVSVQASFSELTRSHPCSSQFSTDHLLSVRASCSELTRSELDTVVMGQLMAGMNDDSRTTPRQRHRERDGQRAAYIFHYQG